MPFCATASAHIGRGVSSPPVIGDNHVDFPFFCLEDELIRVLRISAPVAHRTQHGGRRRTLSGSRKVAAENDLHPLLRDAQHVRPARPERHRVSCLTAGIIESGTAYERIDIIESGTALKNIDILTVRNRVVTSVRQHPALVSALIRGHRLL